MEHTNKKKKSLVLYITMIATLAAFMTAQSFCNMKPSFDKAMIQTASEFNKSCPMMVDKETRLDNAIALPGKIFQYNYTLVNLEKSAIDVDRLKSILEPMVVSKASSEPGLKTFRDNDVTMRYNYKDKN